MTDQDKKNQEQRIGQIRYRTVFEQSMLGNKIISSDLKILQVNQALVDLLGFTAKEDLLGREILDFAHENFVGDWRMLQDRLWKKHLPSFSLETCLVGKDDKAIWVNVNSILFLDNGEYLGYTIIEDIRERRNGLDILRVREQHFRTITDIMPQQVWTAAPDGQLNFVNQQVCAYFGRSADELIGYGWQEFIHRDDISNCLHAWGQALEKGGQYVIEFRLRGFQNNYKWFLGRAVPIRDEQDKIILWLGTNTDIEAQKLNEQKKDEFLSIASHELKTPLTSIKLYNEMMQKTTDPVKQQEFFQKTTTHILRLERLMQDLLDVTKINAGKMMYDIEAFDFDQMLRETVGSFQLLATSHRLDIEKSEPVEIIGDRHRIEQVLNNLLSNAVKYSPDADRVAINAQVSADTVIVSVQDFGIGIPENGLVHLFDRYYRADNAVRRFDGLGLGLFISAEILKRHNGSFWIESEPGKGSTFFFILPLHGQPLIQELSTDGQTYYIANYINVQYDVVNGWLEADWLGYQNEESVKSGCMVILDLLKKNACRKILNDNTHVMGNWSEAADWVNKEWFPLAEKAGLSHLAWIYSPNVFSRLAADKSLSVEPGSFEVTFFTNKTDAATWLRAKE